MVIFLLLFLVFAGVTAALWFQGLWANAINVVNTLLAMIIATNYFEPAATALEGVVGDPKIGYVLDPVMLWAIFAFSYLMLRIFASSFSKWNVEFIMPVEMAGRSILAIWGGWLFTCLTAFSLLIAPIGASPLGAWPSPEAKSFLFLSPEQQWLSFAQSRSLGALGRGKFSAEPVHPDDVNANAEVFDPMSEFIYKYRARRLAAES